MFVGKDMTPAIISEVQKNSPAYVSGMKKNDKILKINGNKVESIMEVSTLINTSTSDYIKFDLLRSDKEIIISVKPNLVQSKDSLGNNTKKRMIGIHLSPPNNQLINETMGPSKALYYSIKEVWFVSITSLNYLFKMILGVADTSQLGGPIRIAKITGQVAEFGLVPF